MFDIGWSELLIIGAVALIAIGPKELPGALRAFGHWMGKVRRMASEFQGQFQEAMREAEMADLKKQVEEATSAANNMANFDPFDGVRQEVDKMQDDLNNALEEKPGEATATEPAAVPAVATSDPGAIAPTAPAETAVPAPEPAAEPAPATADQSPDQPSAPPKAASGERP